MQLHAELTAKNIIRHELLGLNVDVEWKNGRQQKFSGIVVGESRNMLSVQLTKGKKNFPKETCIFSFKLPDGSCVKVDGAVLVGRPEDRLKRVVRKW
ncbi:MAG: ribonuclease P protein subunit [Thaumarchaeota archaeon]|jgi:ribonuclease P protein subunit POP4|nr:ribonuclease P protein subunit [Candidatus Terraquivivens yellowstonensis]MCL7387190.1 ribonuclease P protein subunit [Candidatus Terraquivivens yellowstonensis]MCL7392338.1 ribonuclease P protein subunit [Candidatus Terraquivivens yellowstonensis]MCL7394835.1 ribonuclease P protein subunit [Candidatus Terraquivivens yellowstonensis]MCL7397717.1 ribonuclease P protein subunit [Candidatus Terraquivivens yellowstonensis]